MGAKENQNDLEMTEKLFAFLQGKDLDGCTIKRPYVPKLTADQAWTVIWYLGNLYWQVTDHVERCCVCGLLYDAESSGACLDYGKAPYHFCDGCIYGEEYARKMRRNPDKEAKKLFFER